MGERRSMNQVLNTHPLPGGSLQLISGDITQESVDAIVNAANAQLKHGGGVAAAISRRGGPQIQRESDAWVRAHGPVTHAEPAYTSAGNLPSRYIIHAVGPVWGSGDEDAKLAACVLGSLKRAEELNLTSIAFPAISTGIFGFPKERAARILFSAIEDFFRKHRESPLQQVRITLYDRETLEAFQFVWKSMGYADDSTD